MPQHLPEYMILTKIELFGKCFSMSQRQSYVRYQVSVLEVILVNA